MTIRYVLPFDEAVLGVTTHCVGRSYNGMSEDVLFTHLAPPMTWLRHMLTKPL